MPYDLYGTYYASERDALNAEMAQCAAIDAGIAQRDIQQHRQWMGNAMQENERLNLVLSGLCSHLGLNQDWLAEAAMTGSTYAEIAAAYSTGEKAEEGK